MKPFIAYGMSAFLLIAVFSCKPFKEINRNIEAGAFTTSNPSGNVNFEGFYELLQKFDTLSVLIVHGIGPTKELDYAEQLLIPHIIKSLSEQVTLTLQNAYEEKPTDSSSIRISEYTGDIGGEVHTLRFFAVHWACVTEPVKQELNAQDTLVQRLANTNVVNSSELIKRFLINESFSEVFSYGDDAMKQAIQAPVRKAIEMMTLPNPIPTLTSLSIENYKDYIEDPAHLIPLPRLKQPSPYGFVTLSRSFGGKILFDVIVNDDMKVEGYHANRFCGYTHELFMLANQISLINLMDGALEAKIDHFAARHNELCGDPIKIVAFHDALDILSYNLPEDIAVNQPVDIINVEVNNTSSYIELKQWAQNVLFNLIDPKPEDREILDTKKYQLVEPISTHEGYPNNKLVQYLMANGYSGGEGEQGFKRELKNFPFLGPLEGQLGIEIIEGSTSNKCN